LIAGRGIDVQGLRRDSIRPADRDIGRRNAAQIALREPRGSGDQLVDRDQGARNKMIFDHTSPLVTAVLVEPPWGVKPQTYALREL
jgi:hypothetical protein